MFIIGQNLLENKQKDIWVVFSFRKEEIVPVVMI